VRGFILGGLIVLLIAVAFSRSCFVLSSPQSSSPSVGDQALAIAHSSHTIGRQFPDSKANDIQADKNGSARNRRVSAAGIVTPPRRVERLNLYANVGANQNLQPGAIPGDRDPLKVIALERTDLAACNTISECAYLLLNQRVTVNTKNVYVYKDADSAFNHGFPSRLVRNDRP
jgi:hypothetical protein